MQSIQHYNCFPVRLIFSLIRWQRFWWLNFQHSFVHWIFIREKIYANCCDSKHSLTFNSSFRAHLLISNKIREGKSYNKTREIKCNKIESPSFEFSNYIPFMLWQRRWCLIHQKFIFNIQIQMDSLLFVYPIKC